MKRLSLSVIFLFSIFAPLYAMGSYSKTELSLVPQEPAKVPNYYCTWFVQNYTVAQGTLETIDPLTGNQGNVAARSHINEDNMVGKQKDGWLYRFHPKARRDLIFIMDHGWQEGGFFTSKLNPEKFPSFAKYDYATRLKELNKIVKDAGWRGLGLWTRGNPSKEKIREMVTWSKKAGILYWKIDGGDTSRYFSTTLSDEIYPELVVEHITGHYPLNGVTDKNRNSQPTVGGPSKFADARQVGNILQKTEVFRNYDVTSTLSVATSLQRAVDIIEHGLEDPANTALINVEDEVIMAAALGCTMGVMRHPEADKRILNGKDIDLFLNGNRNWKQRMDEVARALRWQRIAAPMPASYGTLVRSQENLEDDWHFKLGDTFAPWATNKRYTQFAPAVTARNMPLPLVQSGDVAPYVIAARFPNGAVSVATIGRTSAEKGYYHPLAAVTIHAGVSNERIAVFGKYHSLTIRFDRSLGKAKVLAQDLLASEAEDITRKVKIKGNTITLSGKLIEQIGTREQSEGDLSDPGLVLKVRWEK